DYGISTDSGSASLRLDVGRPDDRPPLIDLRLVVSIERLRRLLFARRKLHADVSEAPLRGGVGEGGRDRGVESGGDTRWGAPWAPTSRARTESAGGACPPHRPSARREPERSAA